MHAGSGADSRLPLRDISGRVGEGSGDKIGDLNLTTADLPRLLDRGLSLLGAHAEFKPRNCNGREKIPAGGLLTTEYTEHTEGTIHFLCIPCVLWFNSMDGFYGGLVALIAN